MKINKKFFSIFILVFFFVLLGILIIVNEEFIASADVSKPYKIKFDYDYEDGINQVSESNVVKSKFLSYDGYSNNEIEVQLYGDKYMSEVSYLENGDFISSTSLTIYITSKFTNHKMEVENCSSNSIIDTSLKNSCILNSLTSGSYYVKYIGFTDIQDNGAIYPITINIEFEINIDLNEPTFSGTSLSTKGLFTNIPFEVSIDDSESGVNGFYWRSPKDSAYSLNMSNEKKFTENLINGIYRFYAVDNCGNRTRTNYVYFDDTPPNIIINCDGEKIQNSDIVVDKAFYVTITDNGSGICEVLYKTSYLSEWQTYNENKIADEYGNYFFKATDYAGNSKITTVELVKNTSEHLHTYVSKIIEPTCVDKGYTLFTCSDCGEYYKDNYTNPFGHNYLAVNRPPSCTEYGKTVYKCQICGFEYSEVDGAYPQGHIYTTTIVTAPSCTEAGLRHSICDICGDSFDIVIPANGHNFQITDTKSLNGKTTRTYTCLECGETFTQELGNQYNEVGNYIENLFQLYSMYIWWVLLATAGVWSIIMGVFFVIAQKNEEKEKAKKMIVNYILGLVVIAVVVVACPYLIRGIAALVT